MPTRASPFNRATRRALAKATLCLQRMSRIPTGVRARVAVVDPELLNRIAARISVTIGADGSTRRKPFAAVSATATVFDDDALEAA